MFDIHEANAELDSLKKAFKDQGTLVIEGPETLTRSVAAIPFGILPGQYSFRFAVPDKDGPRVVCSGQFRVDEEAEQEQGGEGVDVLAEAQRLADFKMQERENFYEKMLRLNADAQARIEAERERVWQLMEQRLQGMQKVMLEQAKHAPQTVTVERGADSSKREWWEPLLEKYGDQLFPVVMQAMANMGARDVSFAPEAAS